MNFPIYLQTDQMTCGPTCLRMIAEFYGKSYTLKELVSLSETAKDGSTLLGISVAAEKIGFRTTGVKVNFAALLNQVKLPCIAHWNQQHFVVIYKITKNKIHIADPVAGRLIMTYEEFTKCWVQDTNEAGILLLAEPTPEFYAHEKSGTKKKNTRNVGYLFSYIKPYKKEVLQIILGLICGSILQLIFPFLTQSIVDIGIQTHNISFIYLILLSQLLIFFGRTSIEIIRNYLLLQISSRINISLVSDFFAKLTKLPISFFDTRLSGDLMQRIGDNERIEYFLTGSSLNTLFSLFNFLIFSIVLVWYSLPIFLIFMIGNLLYFGWIIIFLKKRAELDYLKFNQSSAIQSNVYEIINGMQEIKLNNAERSKRWEWESLKAKFYKISFRSLILSQWQNTGSGLINELKNIIITFFSAKLVIDGDISLGIMLSISYIIGQLNTPILEMVDFIQHWQDAKLSLERLSEIQEKENEDNNVGIQGLGVEKIDFKNRAFNLYIDNVSFKYSSLQKEFTLKDISMIIPKNKVTAIVGTSGSGKTTLMKLLLRFYPPNSGKILLEEENNFMNLENIPHEIWRDRCGVVMQDGFIFSDTIARNIALGEENIDRKQLQKATKIANLQEFIHNLPLGYNTKIGSEGLGISAGQKQRILIARAIYKNPDYIFFDEATSALDANNEKVIVNNLNDFFQNKTVVIIAHRLSTVKNADQIIVIEKGEILEIGDHEDLVDRKGKYYELVKNQLELGN